jgi:hypothetical protein
LSGEAALPADRGSREPDVEVFVKQDIFVDVEQGFSEQNLHVLNKAVDAFAEFDPLVARVLHLAQQGQWPREFTLVTIAYYLLHRHKDDYRGTAPDVRTPVPPVRISVDMQPATVAALQSLLKIMQAYPPIEPSSSEHRPVCAACGQDAGQLHKPDCGFQQAITEAERLLRVA